MSIGMAGSVVYMGMGTWLYDMTTIFPWRMGMLTHAIMSTKGGVEVLLEG